MEQPKIVRYGELQPCRSAFIDAHTPGSDQKENFTIIGAGVAESHDQHVHIKATPGFNIGAAGQPPKCFNSLHYHNTAEVFFVLKGKWRFFWGEHGTAGEVIMEEGDIFNIPTRVFRGFENIGSDYGMIMSVLGGDDSGGGVIWAPHVLDAAAAHGLVLAESGALYDTKKGEQLPEGEKPMPKLTREQVAEIPEVSASIVIPNYVKRYWDMMALSKDAPCNVISETGMIKDKTGFNVELLSRHSIAADSYVNPQHEVLMPMRGYWKLKWEGHEEILNPGDTCWVPPGLAHSIEACVTGESSLYRISKTDDPAGLTWTGEQGSI